jgi:two-component system cell cycle sensor histidine kinase/response regulator CckA
MNGGTVDTLQGSETILVVDDETMVRRVATRSLERYGYNVYGASSGLRGWECFREHPDEIDLVLTDVVMPAMTGPEMVQKILGDKPAVKVLFMTGYGREFTLPARSEKRFAVVHKPFTAAGLVQAVRECLSQCE